MCVFAFSRRSSSWLSAQRYLGFTQFSVNLLTVSSIVVDVLLSQRPCRPRLLPSSSSYYDMTPYPTMVTPSSLSHPSSLSSQRSIPTQSTGRPSIRKILERVSPACRDQMKNALDSPAEMSTECKKEVASVMATAAADLEEDPVDSGEPAVAGAAGVGAGAGAGSAAESAQEGEAGSAPAGGDVEEDADVVPVAEVEVSMFDSSTIAVMLFLVGACVAAVAWCAHVHTEMKKQGVYSRKTKKLSLTKQRKQANKKRSMQSF